GCAGHGEIVLLAEARAGAVLAPLMADQAHGGDDVEHGAAEVLRHAVRLARRAELRIAALVLRPEPVHDEAVVLAAPALLRAAAGIVFGAPGRRPGERQDVEIEPLA